MVHLELTPADNAALAPVLTELCTVGDTIESAKLIREAAVRARAVLPCTVVEFLEEYRIAEPSALCVLSGLDVDQQRLGPTPGHWRDSQYASTAYPQEVFFLLCASVLGDPIGWATQQDGRVMHDVLPIRGHEHQEIGSNSVQHLSWHTEDAFHPCRADYVALMCLRNSDAVETVVAATEDIDWSVLDLDLLFAPEYLQMPDNSHRPENSAASGDDPATDRLRARSFALIEQWNRMPEKRPVLFGDRTDPYMVLDPYHMNTDDITPQARRALDGLCAEIERCMRPVALRPGDCVFIDNFRAVHGRNSFRARYDGSDRWLKRLNVTRNIRGSRAWRPAPGDRIIY